MERRLLNAGRTRTFKDVSLGMFNEEQLEYWRGSVGVSLVLARLEYFRFVWRRASALRLRSPEGLRHYSQSKPR